MKKYTKELQSHLISKTGGKFFPLFLIPVRSHFNLYLVVDTYLNPLFTTQSIIQYRAWSTYWKQQNVQSRSLLNMRCLQMRVITQPVLEALNRPKKSKAARTLKFLKPPTSEKSSRYVKVKISVLSLKHAMN